MPIEAKRVSRPTFSLGRSALAARRIQKSRRPCLRSRPMRSRRPKFLRVARAIPEAARERRVTRPTIRVRRALGSSAEKSIAKGPGRGPLLFADQLAADLDVAGRGGLTLIDAAIQQIVLENLAARIDGDQQQRPRLTYLLQVAPQYGDAAEIGVRRVARHVGCLICELDFAILGSWNARRRGSVIIGPNADRLATRGDFLCSGG